MVDCGMMDEIFIQFKDSGLLQFLFVISIEVYGLYDMMFVDVVECDVMLVLVGIIGKDKLELQNYLYYIYYVDQELGCLVDVFVKCECLILLLFYGDYLFVFIYMFQMVGFVDGGDMLNELGIWLLVDLCKVVKLECIVVVLWMLFGLLLQVVGIYDDSYFVLIWLVGLELVLLIYVLDVFELVLDVDFVCIDCDMVSVF